MKDPWGRKELDPGTIELAAKFLSKMEETEFSPVNYFVSKTGNRNATIFMLTIILSDFGTNLKK